jgi:hypothetical protein
MWFFSKTLSISHLHISLDSPSSSRCFPSKFQWSTQHSQRHSCSYCRYPTLKRPLFETSLKASPIWSRNEIVGDRKSWLQIFDTKSGNHLPQTLGEESPESDFVGDFPNIWPKSNQCPEINRLIPQNFGRYTSKSWKIRDLSFPQQLIAGFNWPRGPENCRNQMIHKAHCAPHSGCLRIPEYRTESYLSPFDDSAQFHRTAINGCHSLSSRWACGLRAAFLSQNILRTDQVPASFGLTCKGRRPFWNVRESDRPTDEIEILECRR